MTSRLHLVRNFVRSRVLFQKTYPTYVDALRQCSGDSYLSSDIAKIVAAKTRILAASLRDRAAIDFTATSVLSLTAILHLLRSEQVPVVRVIDFGGACGAHYFQVRAALPDATPLKWAVVETPTMVSAAKEFESDELHFFEDLPTAKSWVVDADLTHSSSTLPYTSEPFEWLKRLIGLSSKYLLLTRMNMTEGDRDIIFVQPSMLSWNGVGKMPAGFLDREVLYPNTAFRKAAFESMIAEKYQILMRFDDPGSARRIGGVSLVGHGVFARLK
jgi:putative methyltransferase (TIGR04325 family)